MDKAKVLMPLCTAKEVITEFEMDCEKQECTDASELWQVVDEVFQYIQEAIDELETT